MVTCENGARQQIFVKEADYSLSPTASLKAILSTMIIDSYEDRDVAITNIPGAYLHTEMPPGKISS